MRKLNAAVFGTGFMGRVHAEAIRRLPNVEVTAVAGSTQSTADQFAAQAGIPRATADWRSLLGDRSLDAIHICTPNALHYPMAKAALESGKHVICEKPLTMNAAEARELGTLARQKQVAHCTNHNLRFYPMVQQVRGMIEAGELGEILMVNGSYFQDWLLYDTDWNWRVNPESNGPLRAMADIGSHWMDMIQHLTGLTITALCADLQTFHKTRKRPDPITVQTEDCGAVLLHLGERARGSFAVSQLSAGRKNRLQLEIYGVNCGVAWDQERPDELWIGHRDRANQIMLKDPSLLNAHAAKFADLPGGHSEGYDDTHKQVFRRFYARVTDAAAPVEYPTFADGIRGMELLEKVLESSCQRRWVQC